MTPYQETEQWTDHSFSYDMDVERDSSSRQWQATSSGDGKINAVKSMKEMVGTGLSLCELSYYYVTMGTKVQYFSSMANILSVHPVLCYCATQ